MLALATLVWLAVALLARRAPRVRSTVSTATSTLLALVAVGGVTAVVAAVVGDRGLAGLLVVVVGAPVAAGAIAAGVWCARSVVVPWQAWRRERAAGHPSWQERVLERAARTGPRVHGVRVVDVVARSAFRVAGVRVTGLAAEMSYYGLISLVPLTTAVGASLGFLRPLLGDDAVDSIRASIVDALTTVFAEHVSVSVVAPLVDGLLDEQRTGFAIGSFLVALWLASRVFRAAVRALDDAYGVDRRRGVVAQYVLGIALALGAIVTAVSVVALVVVGPLLGDGQELTERLGLDAAFRQTWDVLRWPTVVLVCGAYLTLLYRYAPNVDVTWTRCLPGAAVGTSGVLLVSWGFSLYLRVVVPTAPGTEPGSAAVVQAAGQMLGLVLVGVLWGWLTSIVVLVGGVVNAEADPARDVPAGRATGWPASAVVPERGEERAAAGRVGPPA
ncbi:YihY/virulence factor BrkB family protein [Cellulosimicrobium protaetiae]|uniref:YihY/virulence factor BrkB family protein n=1 Tax=Cellulosimicrobium protaetiae TaxID=2587808 RepID=A0A6M5UEM5_9MICO|nr:YihY/virulence factor BrkB family protein [Cellulosimicrobium protaetiae]QJW36484.1 YihY/virulence factor BrkB family protein [Cellulosimicrobium protaetiae]